MMRLVFESYNVKFIDIIAFRIFKLAKTEFTSDTKLIFNRNFVLLTNHKYAHFSRVPKNERILLPEDGRTYKPKSLQFSNNVEEC